MMMRPQVYYFDNNIPIDPTTGEKWPIVDTKYFPNDRLAIHYAKKIGVSHC